MKVIVAGLPKTGTKSMTEALRKLGYTVYDYMENLYYFEHEWKLILNGQGREGLYSEMYSDLDAVVDMPACYFWEDIHKAFPKCKIILTVRDSEDIWLESLMYHMKRLDDLFVARVMQFVEFFTKKKSSALLNSSYKLILGIERGLFQRRSVLDKDELLTKYRNHNSRVIKNAPPDQLLVFNCKDGWEPLCKFLGEQVPDEPFPHVNVHADIMDTAPRLPLAKKYQKEMAYELFINISKYAFLISVAYCVFLYF